MNRLERGNFPEEVWLSAFAASQGALWTALPGIVQSVNFSKGTVEVQPSIQARITAPDASKTWVDMPVCVDCPIVFPSGGGFTLTFPIAAGDEVLIMFASRCIDEWWQSGKVSVQSELRMHDLSDGFVIPGPRSRPKVIGSISTTSVQLRSDDGEAVVEIKPNHDIVLTTSGSLAAAVSGDITAASATASLTTTGTTSITAPTISLTGNVTISGGTLTHNGKNVGSTHTHSGVKSGSDTSGAPT